VTLTADLKRVIDEQWLGFFATVCPDGDLEAGATEQEVRDKWSEHWARVYGRWP
jgi:hypothetical protein